MAWNEPGGNGNKPRDPWGGGDQGPPDLDELFGKLQKRLGGIFGGGGGGGKGSGNVGSSLVFLLAAVTLIWGLFGIYQVDEQERAVVLRFGKFNNISGPGLRWNPPLIDVVKKVNVTKVRASSHNGLMLTEDENIVAVDLSVQYTVSDPKKFHLDVRDPERSLIHAKESALRHVVGSSEMHDVLTDGREQIAIEVQARLQQYLDDYSTGISVTKVNIEETQPPREVQAAFDDVIKAREDEVRLKNEAESYANGIIPESRGLAQRMIEEANAYKQQVIAQAQGETERFEKLLVQYKAAPEVTRERLYLDAVQSVMSNSSKVMVDVEGGNNMMYLPLDKIVGQNDYRQRSGNTGADVRELTDQVVQQLRRDSQNSRRRESR